MSKPMTATARAEIVKLFDDAAFAFEAALNDPSTNDMIFAWQGTALAVAMVDGKVTVTSVTKASPAESFPSNATFTNGLKQTAVKMLRTKALKDAMFAAREQAAKFAAMPVEG
jgi:hypothetical protein